MKKLLYLFIAGTFLISCSSNDDSNLDPIIGKWKLASITLDGKDISIGDECDQKSTVTYLENGYTEDVFFLDNGYGECNKTEEKSTWKNIGNSTYIFNEFEIKLDFFNNNNSYTITINVKNLDNEELSSISTYSRI